MHKTVLVTAPALEPITVQKARSHLNYLGGTDGDIQDLITTARTSLEGELHRAFITQEWKVYYDRWCGELKIPFGNLQLRAAAVGPPAVEKRPLVKYRDTDGNLTTLDEDDFYWVVNTTDPACIVRKYDAVYPELQYGRPDAIEITFLCGYGDAASNVPADIRHAMLLLLTDYFEHRGSIVIGTVNKIPDHVLNLVHRYKLYNF